MPGPKLNNNRRYPDATRQPKHLDSFRKKEAKERQEAYDKLSIEDKIQRLDMKLGVGLGAVKQRAKLAALIAKRNEPKSQEQTQTSPAQEGGEKQKKQNNKKYMKGTK